MNRSPQRRRRSLLVVLSAIAIVAVIAAVGAVRGGSSNPLSSGFDAVGKPIRDFVRWVGDTHDATGQNDGLNREASALRSRVTEQGATLRRLPEMQQLANVLDRAKLRPLDPVLANVSVHDPQAWATSIGIDRGTLQGVRAGQAVVGTSPRGAGLVGFVRSATADRATVSLLPAQDTAVGTTLAGRRPASTLFGAGAATDPGVRLEFVGGNQLKVGTLVTTSGTQNAKYPSLAPPKIPIGRVAEVFLPGGVDQYAHVKLSVDLQLLDFVAVIAKAPGAR